MSIPQFSEMLAEIDASDIVIDPDGDTEPVGNQCSISLSREQADALTAQDIIEFVTQAADLFDAKRRAVAPEHGMVFYCWVDEQVGQLRFSVVSSEPLAFGCDVRFVPDLSMIANQLLECAYLDGISFEELSPATDDALDDDLDSDNKPFTLDVFLLRLPRAAS